MYHVSTTILVSNPPADNRSEQPGPFEYSSIKARRSERNFGISQESLGLEKVLGRDTTNIAEKHSGQRGQKSVIGVKIQGGRESRSILTSYTVTRDCPDDVGELPYGGGH